MLLLLACVHAPRVVDDRSLTYTSQAWIDAPPEHVWDALVDFERYAEWNPWLLHAQGSAVVGERVDAVVLLNGETRDAGHVVLQVDEPSVFCWRDAGAQVAVAYGQRCRWLVAHDGGTQLRVELLVEGPVRGTVDRQYGAAMQTGLDAETAALKDYVEAHP
jgi:uncharacterized protein YndB with AHSA1/START domain